MADPHHRRILDSGVAEWNGWRADQRAEKQADAARFVNIKGMLLAGRDLGEADLSWANLGECDLSHSNLSQANLFRANLSGSNLDGVTGVSCDLSNANCVRAKMWRADFSHARLRRTRLERVDLRQANLIRADLSAANLYWTNFDGAIMHGSQLDSAILFETSFTGTVLERVQGLDKARVLGSCTLDHRTVANSPSLSRRLLRRYGMPEFIVENSAVLRGDPLQFHSVFISYTHEDVELAYKIYRDLVGSGVSCWFAPEALRIGDVFEVHINAAIRTYDKLLVVLSTASIDSPWVAHEVREALDTERQRDETVVFPVRIDDAVFASKERWAHKLGRNRHIGDFTNWKSPGAYQRAFTRLVDDLRAAEPPTQDR